METYSALLAICAGNSPVCGEFPAQRPLTRSFDVFFDLRLIKRLSKHSLCWWFETPSLPFWRHWNNVQRNRGTLLNGGVPISNLSRLRWRIYASVNQPIAGSDNGLSPVRHQTLTWLNASMLSIRTSGTNFSEIWPKTRRFASKKMHRKCGEHHDVHFTLASMR